MQIYRNVKEEKNTTPSRFKEISSLLQPIIKEQSNITGTSKYFNKTRNDTAILIMSRADRQI